MVNRDRDEPLSGIWTGCAIGAVLWVLVIALMVFFLGLPSEAEGQPRASVFEPDFLDGARAWCWERDPICSPVAHAGVTVGVSAVADLTGLLEGDKARWIPLGFYLAKELYDHQRAGDRIPWHDHALDVVGAAVGWWVSGMLFGDS